MIRLSQLSPEAVGEQASSLVHERIVSLAMHVPVAVVGLERSSALVQAMRAEGLDLWADRVRALCEPVAVRHDEVRRAVTQLAHYAIHGRAPEGRPELVAEYLISMVSFGLAPDDVHDAEPDDEIGVVVVAALARDCLASVAPTIATLWVAVLAEVEPATVRRAAALGELERPASGDGLTTESARRWLRGRGVVGV